jgi:hypothetical protein
VAKLPKKGVMVGIRTWCRLCAIIAPILLPIGADGELGGIHYASFVLFPNHSRLGWPILWQLLLFRSPW